MRPAMRAGGQLHFQRRKQLHVTVYVNRKI